MGKINQYNKEDFITVLSWCVDIGLYVCLIIACVMYGMRVNAEHTMAVCNDFITENLSMYIPSDKMIMPFPHSQNLSIGGDYEPLKTDSG